MSHAGGEPRRKVRIDGEGRQVVDCPRLGRPLPVDEHLECPYCFGAETDVRQGTIERFCDFQPGEDPTQFGDPYGHGRKPKR
jgi:hypothetical protein